METRKTLPWVKGNKLTLWFKMEKGTVTDEGVEKEDYEPPVGSAIKVLFRGRLKSYEYEAVLTGKNTIVIVDNGMLAVGTYGVEIRVTEPDGTLRRSMWNNQIDVRDSNEGVMEAFDDFIETSGDATGSELVETAMFLETSELVDVITTEEMDDVLSNT